jgi:chemotaxis protein methyltransferase CheR
MTPDEIEPIEIDLLLEALFRRCGYDFRSYARASIDRRVRQFLSASGCKTISELVPRVMHDAEFLAALVRYFSISVTEMFRDPLVYRAVREKVIPLLRTYPFFNVWHAGCATGEEVYSLAIVLAEEGLLERATLYATDFNDEALAQARKGIYPLDRMGEFTQNYYDAGGRTSFAEYYHARYGSAVMAGSLKGRITFANHNLVTDEVFGEMHLVFCRNVLIYFNKELQNRVLRLITDSLARGGFLCLGTKEDIQFTDAAACYETLDREARLFKKKAAP